MRTRQGRGTQSRDSYGRFTEQDNRGGYNDYDRDRDYESDNRGHGRGGWSGDSEEHSEAAERGWENRRGGSQRGNYDYDDDRSYGRNNRREDYDNDYNRDYESDDRRGSSGRGWYGDSESHSEAAEKGWENRQGGHQRQGGNQGSFRYSSSNRSNGGSRRGFAAMDEDEQREIASMGGRAAHRSGHAHEWDSEEARRAGRLGGKARWGSHHSREYQY